MFKRPRTNILKSASLVKYDRCVLFADIIYTIVETLKRPWSPGLGSFMILLRLRCGMAEVLKSMKIREPSCMFRAAFQEYSVVLLWLI